ncbi:hypothetical protein BDN70DRAFT_938750 [Pholiota conissans]|uniref:Uncharacterized protein n=1 Tax=Pholiota conissans TaxID=109636 RepID=A0A9P5YQ93_9AGAR|nr:hypothetical protein BDN70DRAFT_938750 [Pholiota conissans]
MSDSESQTVHSSASSSEVSEPSEPSSDELTPWELMSDISKILEIRRMEENLDDFDGRYLYSGITIGRFALRAIRRIAIDMKKQGFTVRDVATSEALFNVVVHLRRSEADVLESYKEEGGIEEVHCRETLWLVEMASSALRKRDCTYRDEGLLL